MSDGLQSPGNAAMLACGWLGETVYFLPHRGRILPVFLWRFLFVSFYKAADSITQQIRHYPYKTQTAITGRQPVKIWKKKNSYKLADDSHVTLKSLLTVGW